VNTFYGNKQSLTETLYNQAYIQKFSKELTTGSKIGTLTYYGANSDSPLNANVVIYMKNESNEKLGGTPNSPIFTDTSTMQKVYDGEITINKQSGGELVTVSLDTPFVYEGEGISVQIEANLKGSSTIYYYSDRVSSNGCTSYNIYESFPASDNRSSSNIPTIGFGLAADVAVVSGTVTHATSKEPLADVAITLESPENVVYKTTTDENGQYTVNVLQPDKKYKVKASKDKLDDYESEEYLDLSGLNAEHHFTMTGVTTGVESIQAGALRIKAVAGGILISAENEADVSVYDLLGRAVLRLEGFAGEKRVSLPAGIYVVNNRKVAVK
ncbi:MAG: carboxypeptidase-like regulatory domain-containing protein, partial [Muribaculaceae bacterium]|nr:carboxypeptidase-like regulatory domain-containing protein [Muribaculaceae bacterium]